jgi:hypothetical protein
MDVWVEVQIDCKPPLQRTLAPFYQHQCLDVRDSDDNWIEARVLEVGYNGTVQSSIRVHFRGWKDKYDETLNLSFQCDLDRIALLHTHTTKPINRHPISSLFRGMALCVLDTRDIWQQALVDDIWIEHGMVHVRYVGWVARHDEWLNIESPRLTAWFNCATFVTAEEEELDARCKAERKAAVAFKSEHKLEHKLEQRVTVKFGSQGERKADSKLKTEVESKVIFNDFDPDLFVEIHALQALDLVCPVCRFLCRQVVETEQCGHFFCKGCISQAFVTKPNVCPTCRTTNVTVKASVSSGRRIDDANVRCPVVGCDFKCVRKQLAAHVHSKH